MAPPGERRVLSANPPNYESPLHLVKGFLTPTPLHFVRTHDPVPRIKVEEWRLRVEGNAVERAVELTFDDLLKLPSRSVVCFLECAGNGRSFFADLLGRRAEGNQWRLGAISVSEWTGVPLAAVLELAGLKPDARDVLIEGLDQLKINRPIPIEKALDPNTILAYAMNGGEIPPDHGYPVRAVVPEWVGINNIKWIVLLTIAFAVSVWGVLAAGTGAQTGSTADASQLFDRHCARCHGPSGEGGIGPRIIGPGHNLAKFRNGQLLFEYTKSTMPQDAPGSLKTEEYRQLIVYILRANGYLKAEETPPPERMAQISLD